MIHPDWAQYQLLCRNDRAFYTGRHSYAGPTPCHQTQQLSNIFLRILAWYILLFCLILYCAPAMTLTWYCHLNQYIATYLLTYLLQWICEHFLPVKMVQKYSNWLSCSTTVIKSKPTGSSPNTVHIIFTYNDLAMILSFSSALYIYIWLYSSLHY